MHHSIRNPERLGDGASIPPMTHKLSAHWRQPHRDHILLDAKHAVMDVATFALLAEYSTSMPSGVYEGKMWKARCHRGMQHGRIVWVEPEKWQLRWYGFCEEPNSCSNNFREIIVV